MQTEAPVSTQAQQKLIYFKEDSEARGGVTSIHHTVELYKCHQSIGIYPVYIYRLLVVGASWSGKTADRGTLSGSRVEQGRVAWVTVQPRTTRQPRQIYTRAEGRSYS